MSNKKKIITKDGKVLLQVLISRELYERLLEVAPRLYGKNKGALSWAVEEALRVWLAPRTHTTHANPPRKIWLKFKSVKRAIAQILGIPEEEIRDVTVRVLELAISNTIGSDPRTIDKYLKLFEKFGLIKRMTRPGIPRDKWVYEVLG